MDFIDSSRHSGISGTEFFQAEINKNYLRTTMSQKRLNILAMLSIEKERAESLEY